MSRVDQSERRGFLADGSARRHARAGGVWAESAGASNAPDIEGRSILVVDDEPVFARTLADGLRAELPGVEVRVAHHGAEALEVLGNGTIDLVVTDVNMPVMDGTALVAAMVSRGIHLPVIMVTAFGNRELELGARRHGVISVIDKPIDFALLVEICASSLRSVSRGAVQGITLPGFLQLLELERRSCTVRIHERGQRGFIAVRDGVMMSCVVGQRQGMDALCEILSWRAPRIEMASWIELESVEQPIPLGAALLEGARRIDEVHRDDQAQREGAADRSEQARQSDDEAHRGRQAQREGVAGRGDEARRGAPAGPRDGSSRGLRSHGEQRSPAAAAPAPQASASGVPCGASSRPGRTGDPGEAAAARPACASIERALQAGMAVEGAIAVALVDHHSGTILGSESDVGFPIEVAATGNTEIVRAKLRVMKEIGTKGGISDVLITLHSEYHLIRPLRRGTQFLYLALDKTRGNLGLARCQLSRIERELASRG